MLDIREIEYWVSRYERESTEAEDYVVLSALYCIRDRMLGISQAAPQITAYAEVSPVQPLEQYGNSEFLEAIAGKEPSAAWAVMDDLMETLHVVNPRVYNSVMRKMQAL